MDISIIIPTYNNSRMLASTLQSFVNMDFPKKSEIVVVNNNSNDNTEDTIKAFSDLIPIVYVFEPKQGISAAKNRGIDVAKGDLIVFTDDDVRPCRDWLNIYFSAFRKNSEGLFWGGRIISEFEGTEPVNSLLRFAPPSVRGQNFGNSKRLLNNDEWFVSANLAITAKSIQQIGGFDIKLGLNPNSGMVLVGEESDFQQRLKLAGYQAMYLPSASIRHVVPSQKCTLKHIADRAEATGRYKRVAFSAESNVETFRGIPLWRYRKCIERYFSFWKKRILGQDWYPDYISYRADIGFLKGLPSDRKGR